MGLVRDGGIYYLCTEKEKKRGCLNIRGGKGVGRKLQEVRGERGREEGLISLLTHKVRKACDRLRTVITSIVITAVRGRAT